MRHTVWFLLVAVLLLSATASWAEPPGRSVLLELRDGYVYVGSLVKADRATITLQTPQGERIFQLGDVKRITFGSSASTSGPQERPLDEEFVDLVRTILQKAKRTMQEMELSPPQAKPSP